MAATSPVVPLADAPDVVDFLARLGLGTLDPDVVSSFAGRNDIWSGVTSTGFPVFVKRVTGDARDVRQRLRRMEAMADAVQDHPVLRTPRCLGIDEKAHLAAFTLLQDSVTAAELIAGGGFGKELAHEAGLLVATQHELTPPDVIAHDRSHHALPPTPWLAALPLEAYVAASGAELDLWRIIHNDATLIAAIRQLRIRERQAARAVTHGDLRLDQLLVHDGRLYLTDWEECRLADPARDVGAFVGECLHRAVLAMASAEGADERVPSDSDVLAGGVHEFERLRPLIESFGDGYRAARPAVGDPGLAMRAVAFAGWHLFDRVLAGAARRAVLSPLERAAAGVGRGALVNPELLVETMGLGGGG